MFNFNEKCDNLPKLSGVNEGGENEEVKGILKCSIAKIIKDFELIVQK